MSAFLNLALFVGVFYLIILCAGWPDRHMSKTNTPEARGDEKRIA